MRIHFIYTCRRKYDNTNLQFSNINIVYFKFDTFSSNYRSSSVKIYHIIFFILMAFICICVRVQKFVSICIIIYFNGIILVIIQIILTKNISKYKI